MIKQRAEIRNQLESSSHQVCQKTPEALSFICRSIESEYNIIKNQGVLCGKNAELLHSCQFRSQKLI